MPEPEPGRVPMVLDLERLGPEPREVFFGPPHAVQLTKSVLEGSGIPCVVWGSGLEEAYGPLTPHRVMVPAHEAERASEIIRAAGRGEFDLDMSFDDQSGETSIEHDPAEFEPYGEPVPGTPPSSDPISEVRGWWNHPGLPAVVSAARVVLGIGIVVGLAYLILAAVAD